MRDSVDIPTTKCDGCGQPVSPIYYFHHIAGCVVDLRDALTAAQARVEELAGVMSQCAEMLELSDDGDSAPVDAAVMLRAAVEKAMKG